MISWLSGASSAIFLPLFIAGWISLLCWFIDCIRKKNKVETAVAASVFLYTLFMFVWRCKLNVTSSRYHFGCGILLLVCFGWWGFLSRSTHKALKVCCFFLMILLLGSSLFRCFWQFKKNKNFAPLGQFLKEQMKHYERPVIVGLGGESTRIKYYTGLDAFTSIHLDIYQKELIFLLQESDCIFALSSPKRLKLTCSLFPPERPLVKIGYDPKTNMVICKSENPQWRKKAISPEGIPDRIETNENTVFAEDFENPVFVVCKDDLAFRVLKSRGLIAGDKTLFVKTMEPHGGFGLVNMKDARFEVSSENVVAGKYSLLVHLPYCSGGMLLKQNFSNKQSYRGELYFKGTARSRFTLGYWPKQQPIINMAIEQTDEIYHVTWEQPAGEGPSSQYQLYFFFYSDTVIVDNIRINQI